MQKIPYKNGGIYLPNRIPGTGITWHKENCDFGNPEFVAMFCRDN